MAIAVMVVAVCMLVPGGGRAGSVFGHNASFTCDEGRSWGAIQRELYSHGFRARNGKEFQIVQIQRIYEWEKKRGENLQGDGWRRVLWGDGSRLRTGELYRRDGWAEIGMTKGYHRW